MVVYCFNFFGRPPGTNEFASHSCSHSRRVRRRLPRVALRHSLVGPLVALLRTTGGQVGFLRSPITPGGLLALALLGLLRTTFGEVVLHRLAGRKIGGKVGARQALRTKVSNDGSLHVMELVM